MAKKTKKLHPVKSRKAGAKQFNGVKFPSELRMDLVGADWVVIATGRARRPESFKKETRLRQSFGGQERTCPFCKIIKNQSVIVVPNKFPAFLPYSKLNERTEGELHKKMNAVGFHEIVITRDHKKQIAQFSVEQVKEVFDVYQERYLSLMPKKFVNHISIFHNHGQEAGASIAHPHSQIITTPLIDIDLQQALSRAQSYYRKHKKCIYCQMNKWEKRIKKRIVFENRSFRVVCPFASRTAFEVIVSPKKHLAYFERIKEKEKRDLAEAFSESLNKIYKGLRDPAYNFYLHTAPCDGKNHDYYHWHWTILPKTAIPAGFELGTGIEISTIEPEKAAEYLRKQ